MSDEPTKLHNNSQEMWDQYYATEQSKTGWFDSVVHAGREVYFSKLFAKRVIQLGGPAESYLEVGVGSGQTIVRLQKMTGAHCTGLEKTPRAYEIGKAHATNCQITLGDAMAMPFPDRAFDVVYSLGLLEHFEPEEQRRILYEHARCARKAVVLALPPTSLQMKAILHVNREFFGRTGVWADEELFSIDHMCKKYPGLSFGYFMDYPALGLVCWITLQPHEVREYAEKIW